ncbi:MAG: propionyl-CoA--succinate CoA transferase [Patulibacter minatonensis]
MGRVRDLLPLIEPGADLIVAMAAGEPDGALELLELEFAQLSGVRVHQMHAAAHRASMDGAYREHLQHVSYFLSASTRAAFEAGTCELVPADFSAVPRTLQEHTRCSLVLATVSPPDADGWCTLGTNAEYVAALRGRAPFFLEVNEQMPRTAGDHRIRLEDAAGWYEADRPLHTVALRPPDERDRAIAAHIAERIPDGATVQLGIGNLPDAVAEALSGHRDLGIHSELIGDGIRQLIESGVATGARKAVMPGVAVGTFALGSSELYRWMDRNPAVELHRVDWVNDPAVIAQDRCVVSVNATTEVDLYGQCASETIAGRYWSSSGGQSDFAHGAVASPRGQSFIALRSTTSSGRGRIRPILTPGSVVTTSKNVIDHVVTEHGVAELQGRSLSQRAEALIAIADPRHRDELRYDARQLGLLRAP